MTRITEIQTNEGYHRLARESNLPPPSYRGVKATVMVGGKNEKEAKRQQIRRSHVH
jgi:hypothetical protein